MLPDQEPFKCPKCDYSHTKKYVLMLHFGITHKEVLKLIEEASKKMGESMIVLNKTSSVPALVHQKSKAQPKKPSTGSNLAFDCPMCSLSISPGHKRQHLAKHFYAQLSSEVSSQLEPPFECHLCRHVAINRHCLIKHVAVAHQLVDQYVKDYLSSDTAEDSDTNMLEVKVESCEAEPLEAQRPANVNGIECRLCDKPQFFK